MNAITIKFPNIEGCTESDRHGRFNIGGVKGYFNYNIDRTGYCERCGRYHFKIATVPDPEYKIVEKKVTVRGKTVTVKDRPTMKVTYWTGKAVDNNGTIEDRGYVEYFGGFDDGVQPLITGSLLTKPLHKIG